MKLDVNLNILMTSMSFFELAQTPIQLLLERKQDYHIHRVHKKNSEVCFFAISQLLLCQIQKVRSVLNTTGSENFKTVPTFDIWPSRS